MSWEPTQNAFDTTQIDGNLAAYLAAKQADALKWANGGNALKLFNFGEDALADPDKPNLPALLIAGDGETEESDDDALVVAYRIDYRAVVFAESAATIRPLAKKYANALKSMLKNISTIELFAGIPRTQLLLSATVSANYDEPGASKKLKGHVQYFNVRAVYRLLDQSEI